MSNRHPSKVADKILTLIPTTPETLEFRTSLEKLSSDGKYKAPEQFLELWQRGAFLLEMFLPGPDELTEQWQVDTVNLWMNREAVKLKG